MSFNFIYNPLTNEKYSIFSYEGKFLLKQYIKEYQTGGSGLPTVKGVYGDTAIPLPPPVLKRPNSLETHLRQSDEMRNNQLKRDVEKLPKSKQTKSKKTKSKCDKLNEKMNKINEKAQKKIGELREIYDNGGCNPKYNTRVTDAFDTINVFGPR